MAQTWGDPTTETFRKKHIREARAAGGVALVNAQILSITARLIEGLSDLHVEIPEDVVSFSETGTEHQRLGLALHLAIPVPPSPEIGALVQRWGFDGFQLDDDDVIELHFTGTPEQANDLNDEALAIHLDRLEGEDVSGPPLVKWPGSRDLVDGDHGQDVQFLRLVFNLGSEAPVDASLFDAVRKFQARRGAPVTGRIDVDFWRRLIPGKLPHVSQGESGFIVRIIQAALATYENATTRVSGIWGILTTRDVVAMQKEYGLRGGSFVRAPEWALLLGPANPRLEEARRLAKGVGVERPTIPESIGTPAPPSGGKIGGVATDGRFGGKLGIIHTEIPKGVTVTVGGLHPTGEAPPMSINGVDVEHLRSEEHKPVQHRDGKEPWCAVCKMNADGFQPVRIKVDPNAPAKKRSAPASAPKKTKTP